MDFRAVKAASQSDLASCAIAAGRNAQGLLQDAELLAASGRKARAYTLAVFAVEECGKAMSLVAVAFMPGRLREQVPIRRMLDWHQLKLVGGLLLAAVPMETVASRLAGMADAELTQVLAILDAPADEADRLKRRGLYVDLDADGKIRNPSEITEAEAAGQLGRARQAAASAFVLLEPDAQTRLEHPPGVGVEFAEALVAALIDCGDARTPQAAADVIRQAVARYRDRP
jgi:AbiV family abortive infection protein